MWNEPTKEQLAKIPRLHETENIPLKDKPIYLHFFIGRCDWFLSANMTAKTSSLATPSSATQDLVSGDTSLSKS